MRNYKKLEEQANTAIDGAKKEAENLNVVADEARRVSEIARDVHIIIKDLDRQFQQATKLNATDIKFLFFATALQCIRQYLIEYITQREDDAKAADKVKGDKEEHSDRNHQWYCPSLEQIETNPVPYDATDGSKTFNIGGGTSDKPKGLGGSTHRFETPGHDPLLGWVFGTANITTSTLTSWRMIESYHIKTGRRDEIRYHANTRKVFLHTKDRLINEPQAVALAITKQARHFASDIYSTQSLPIPVVGAFSPNLARELASYGFDFGNVAKITMQASFAVLINSLVAMIHRLFYDEAVHGSRRLYEVKTRKILSYSNVIASVSNILQAAFRAFALGDIKGGVNSLDIDGFIVTLYRLITDYKFIKNIKFEFLENEFYNIVMGDDFIF